MPTHYSRASAAFRRPGGGLVTAAFACLALLAASPALTAQSADSVIGSYIGAVDVLASRLQAMSDANEAQRGALELTGLINNLNPLVAQMKAVYGNPASQQALQSNADRLNTSQTRLQQQQSRVLTGDCNPNTAALAAKVGLSPDTTPIRVTFQNRTREVVTLYWIVDRTTTAQIPSIDYRNPKATLQPNTSFTADTFAMHVWVATNAPGACLNFFQPTSAGTHIISGSLAPTLGPFLANIAK